MYHSITIDQKNTWSDWSLLPATQPVVAPPKVKKNVVDIPLGNGSIDLTGLNGGPFYGNREGTWDFVAAHDHLEYHALIEEISRYVHGKRCRVQLEDDPMHYYLGQLELSKAHVGKITIELSLSYSLDPYKYDVDGDTPSIY